MLPNAGIHRYRTVQVTTSSPGQLLLMLYDGLFRYLVEAQYACKEKDLGRLGERISKAHAILSELVNGLNPQVAPDLCDNLEGIYLFCMSRLVEANLQQDETKIAEVIRILGPLREAWVTAVKEVASQAESQ